MDGEPCYPVEYVVIDVRTDGVGGAAQFAWDAGRRAATSRSAATPRAEPRPAIDRAGRPAET